MENGGERLQKEDCRYIFEPNKYNRHSLTDEKTSLSKIFKRCTYCRKESINVCRLIQIKYLFFKLQHVLFLTVPLEKYA